MLKLIDRLARWWLNWRMEMLVKRTPSYSRFKQAEITPNGFSLVVDAPGIVELAQQAAALLDANDAENYVQFAMLPHLASEVKPVSITVAWANGELPAEKADRLKRENDLLRVKLERLAPEASPTSE
jgi:hypothetical protein